jgi:hypothetical protein
MTPARTRKNTSIPPDDRLLAGEDPDTIRSRDAYYWLNIYREMVGFKKQLLARVSNDLRSVSPVARIDLGNDVVLIERQLARYERRVQYWSERAGELTAADGTGDIDEGNPPQVFFLRATIAYPTGTDGRRGSFSEDFVKTLSLARPPSARNWAVTLEAAVGCIVRTSVEAQSERDARQQVSQAVKESSVRLNERPGQVVIKTLTSGPVARLSAPRRQP